MEEKNVSAVTEAGGPCQDTPRVEGLQGASPANPGSEVVLQVELATKPVARVMQWAVWVLMLLLFASSIVLVAEKSTIQGQHSQPRSKRYYVGVLGVAALSLTALLSFGAVFLVRCWRAAQQHKRWSIRQKGIAMDAAVTLVSEGVICTCWLGAYASVVGADCFWPAKTVAAFSLVRWTFFSWLLLWMLVMMHGMTRRNPSGSHSLTFRARCARLLGRADGSEKTSGPARPGSSQQADPQAAEPCPLDIAQPQALQAQSVGRATQIQVPVAATASPLLAPAAPVAAAPDPDRLLVIDCPVAEQLRLHAPKLVLWVVLEVCAVLQAVRQLGDNAVAIAIGEGCGEEGAAGCKLNSRDRAALAVSAVMVLLYVVFYFIYQSRAFKDHASLPYTKYRMTNIYIRVQLRNASAMLVAVVFSLLVMQLVGINSCWIYLDSQLGLLPMNLALVIMALASAFLYMPATTLGAPMVQAWLQEFAWTVPSLPAIKARRGAELRASLAGLPTLEQWLLPTLLPHLLASKEAAHGSAAAALDKEPVFCLETAIRLFYWSRLAYQYGDPESLVTESHALSLFGLQQCECLYEPSTDTKAVLGWGGGGNGTIVLTFRGTASRRNAMTDIKAVKTYHLPRRRHRGRMVLVHLGFYEAWMSEGFSSRVLERVGELVEASHVSSEALSFFVTGHSLGGALANLAAFALKERWPASNIVVYTFGAPRLGGAAFAAEYKAAGLDSWGIVNDQDPVPRIPKVMYKHVGRRVTVNRAGDMLVRPSFFELSVINKTGGSVKHHMTGAYALAMAAVVKSQFSPAKCLPGGEEGARELASRLDLGATLVLEGMDLKSLQDPLVIPRPRLPAKPKAKQQAFSRRHLSRLAWCCGGEGQQEEAAAAGQQPAVAGAVGGEGGTKASPVNMDTQLEPES